MHQRVIIIHLPSPSPFLPPCVLYHEADLLDRSDELDHCNLMKLLVWFSLF